jgi:hypothetical protein
MKLTELANKYRTDKGTTAFESHGYTEVYQNYIYAHLPCTLLEIGVQFGDSIRMWNEYNPNMIVHAIDYNEGLMRYDGNEKFTFHIGNQSDENFINGIMDQIPDVDYVIDDGSHYLNDTFNSFKYIFPKLKKGAVYFIEDLHFPPSEPKNLIYKIIEECDKGLYDKPEIIWTSNLKLLILKK